MANENITDALAELKIILADIDPSPEPVPTAIYQFPEDFETEAQRAAIDYTDLPLMICLNQVNIPNLWQPATHGTIWHTWMCDVLTFLTPEITSIRQEAEAKVKYVSWLRAMQLILFQNQGLNGTCTAIGSNEYLFRYRVGNMGWIDTKVFWGVRFSFPIIQEHSQT